MVHWGFLILAFVLGGLACYGCLYWVASSGSAFFDWLYKE
jgi:hypothetical protein